MKSPLHLPAAPRRALFVLLTLVFLLGLVALGEAGLRLAGFGASYPLFVPVPEAPGFLHVNHRVIFRFMVDEELTPKLWIRPVRFRKEKSPHTFRIFVQGGSTAEGYPYGYGASPAGMLQQRLQRTFPERDIEVVTTAMSAVNSYTLLDFSREIAAHAPDAVLIYAGHNEYVGILGVGSGYSVGRRRPLVLAFLGMKDFRIFQLARRTLTVGRVGLGADPSHTLMATIAAEKRIPLGSPLYRRGLAQYRDNLRALLRRYRRSGVPVFIGTVVSNERDQAPFIAGHGSGVDIDAWRRHMDAALVSNRSGDLTAALGELDAAVAIDDLHAEGHFRRAQALAALGRHADARRAYLDAKDRDLLRFRAPEAINEILREVAAEERATVVEVQEAFATAAIDGSVGFDLMLEHVHPNLEGYFLLADAFYEAMRRAELITPWDRPVGRDEARSEMPVTAVDRIYGNTRIRHLTSDWPFSERRQRLQVPAPTDRTEAIAYRYYRGLDDWPSAMRQLLQHHRTVGNRSAAATVAVLLAEAFPDSAADQEAAAELLEAAERSGAIVYRRRAAALARSPRVGLESPSTATDQTGSAGFPVPSQPLLSAQLARRIRGRGTAGGKPAGDQGSSSKQES